MDNCYNLNGIRQILPFIISTFSVCQIYIMVISNKITEQSGLYITKCYEGSNFKSSIVKNSSFQMRSSRHLSAYCLRSHRAVNNLTK